MEAFLQCCHLMQCLKITMPFETNSSALKRLKTHKTITKKCRENFRDVTKEYTTGNQTHFCVLNCPAGALVRRSSKKFTHGHFHVRANTPEATMAKPH